MVSNRHSSSYGSHTFINRKSALFGEAKNSTSESSYCSLSIQIQLMLGWVLVNGSSRHGSFTLSTFNTLISLSLQSHGVRAAFLGLAFKLLLFVYHLCFSTPRTLRSYFGFISFIVLF